MYISVRYSIAGLILENKGIRVVGESSRVPIAGIPATNGGRLGRVGRIMTRV